MSRPKLTRGDIITKVSQNKVDEASLLIAQEDNTEISYDFNGKQLFN